MRFFHFTTSMSLGLFALMGIVWATVPEGESHVTSGTGSFAKNSAGAELPDEVRKTVGNLVEVFQQSNLRKYEKAFELINQLLIVPIDDSARVVEWVQDGREQSLQKLIGTVEGYESIELIGYQRLSSQSMRLVLIGHGPRGPAKYEFLMQQLGGAWRISGLHWLVLSQLGVREFAEVSNEIMAHKLSTPLPFRLMLPPPVSEIQGESERFD